MSLLFRASSATLLIVLACTGFCQDGVSTAGLARSKYFEKVDAIPPSREVVVEDFINYHRHEIPRPKAGESVALDLRWLNESLARKQDVVLQVGISTALAHDTEHLKALNLCFVIDVSGSMADDGKLDNVKRAMLTLLPKLRPTDTVSIVTFDDKAQVMLPAQSFGDGSLSREVIGYLQPGTSTNLNEGLMTGYSQALEHYKKNCTNRVILLTDGIANVGLVDPKDIAENSRKFNDRGVDLSTIAVGRDVNIDLLSALAKSGHGLFHFVEDGADIQKVFQDEMQSLVSPVAKNAQLEIDCGPNFRIEKVYGYDPKIDGHIAHVDLDNMNSGMTEVVLLTLKPVGEGVRVPVKVRLSYTDLDADKQITNQQSAGFSFSNRTTADDETVEKNFTIAVLAQAIHDAAELNETQHCMEAQKALDQAIATARENYPNVEDNDIARVLKMAITYQSLLRPKYSEALPPRTDVRHNLVPNGDFANGNIAFRSDLGFTPPRENCLWPVGYTIAQSFSRPQLHRLISSQDFSAPDGGQVMFANAGGTGELTLWSATVRCQPHTRYRVRFHSISLSPGREWIPTYEIRLGNYRSDPQVSSDGTYNTIQAEWTSGNEKSARLSIVRLPIPHGGGIVGIANVEMVPIP